MKDIVKKIVYIVTAFVITGVALFNSFSVPVLASTQVESLPRTDIDVEVVVNSSGFSMQHNGNVYDIPFHYDIRLRNDNGEPYDNWLFWHDRNTLEHVYYSDKYGCSPKYTDMDAYGNILYYSYWFSPSENRIYVFTHMNEDSVIQSYSGSTFHFLGESYTYTSVNYWDLNTMEFNRIGMLGMLVGNNTICGVKPYYKVATNNIISGYADSDFSWKRFPTDMLCVYSNYEISGFYEMDFSSVYTPAYYFEYQYLFYSEGIGYVFIDSALPLVNVEDKKNGYAFINYLDYCNSHVYTSVDGIQWSEHTSVSSMYSNHHQIDYSWFFDNVGGVYLAVLVYSSDKEYGVEPILPPEFLEEYFSSEVFDVEQIIYLLDYSVNYPKGEVPEADKNWFDVLVYATQSFKGDIVSFYRYYQSLQDDSLVKEFTNFIEQQTILKSFTEDYVFEYVFHDDGTYTPVHKVSLYGFVKLMNKSLVNIDTDLNNIQLNLHNDLKSVFDNISLTNSYMKSIDLAISDLSDYTKQFNESIGVQKDILEALEKIETDAGSSDSVIAIDIDKTYLDSWLSELDSSIDNVAGLVAMDEMTDAFDTVVDSSGNTVGTLSTFLDDVVKDENTLMQLDEVGVYVSSAMSSITKLKVLDSAFTYAGGLSNGIGFINAYADSFYNASGNYAPVFIVGSAMVCVNMFVRRRE